MEKFAVGYPVPTDWVEMLLDYYNNDINKAHLILLKTKEPVSYTHLTLPTNSRV